MNDYIKSLFNYLNQFKNQTTDDLFLKLQIDSKAKSKNYILSRALIDSYEGKAIAKAKAERYKLNIKTIQLKENSNPKEAMSFSPINFLKIVTENWLESGFRSYLRQNFIFFVYKNDGISNYLYKIIFWTMPLEDLDGETKLVWEDTKKKISDGTVIKEIKNGKIITWFLGESVTNICHVRPHGANGSDIAKLPIRDRLTGYEHLLKQSFWFNHSYLKGIVENN